VETNCQIKAITFTSHVDYNLFLLTLYLTNGMTKVKEEEEEERKKKK